MVGVFCLLMMFPASSVLFVHVVMGTPAGAVIHSLSNQLACFSCNEEAGWDPSAGVASAFLVDSSAVAYAPGGLQC